MWAFFFLQPVTLNSRHALGKSHYEEPWQWLYLSFSVLQVLKAIGLQRTGKQDEAFTLAQEVSTLEPTDDNSLQALTILYREMHRREYIRANTRFSDVLEGLGVSFCVCCKQRSWLRSCTKLQWRRFRWARSITLTSSWPTLVWGSIRRCSR